jgi:hypothetical protein
MEDLYTVEDVEAEDAKSEEPNEIVTENEGDDSATDTAAPENPDTDQVDYEALIASDVATLKADFPELAGIKDITDLNNPLRYAALRDLGLSPAEAYMATAKRSTRDNRSHLASARGKSMTADAGVMSQYELATARELFPGRSDSELQRLYKRVTK